jgi:hypothetical protein
MRDPLRQPERLCRARGNPSDDGQRLVEQLVIRHRSVDQIPLRDLGAIQQSAGIDEFQSAMFAESMDQMMVAAAVENGANASER